MKTLSPIQLLRILFSVSKDVDDYSAVIEIYEKSTIDRLKKEILEAVFPRHITAQIFSELKDKSLPNQ